MNIKNYLRDVVWKRIRSWFRSKTVGVPSIFILRTARVSGPTKRRKNKKKKS